MSGRGKAQKTIALIDASVDILAEISPASIRAVCYRLFAAGLIDSMSRSNTNKISRLLVEAREAGVLPWEWVVDETRETERISSWRDLAEFGDVVKKAYRRDYWATQPNRIEVWSEKGTVRGSLAPVLNEYGVTFRVMHGHGSATAVYTAAQESLQDDRPLIVLYVGDWDPSGLHMSEIDLPERLVRYGGNVVMKRIAIAPIDTVPDAGVQHFSADDKWNDPRHGWFVENYSKRCFELDALNPKILRGRVEQEIRDRLDLEAWSRAIEVEAAEVESMRNFKFPTISVPANKYSDGWAR